MRLVYIGKKGFNELKGWIRTSHPIHPIEKGDGPAKNPLILFIYYSG